MEVLFHLHCHLFTCYNFRCFSGEFEEHNIWKVPPHRKLSCIIVNQIFPSSWWQVSLLNGRTAASSFWKIGVDLSNGFSPTTTSVVSFYTHPRTPLHVFGKLLIGQEITDTCLWSLQKSHSVNMCFFFCSFLNKITFSPVSVWCRYIALSGLHLKALQSFCCPSTIYFSKMTFSFRGKSLNAKIHVWYSWIKK